MLRFLKMPYFEVGLLLEGGTFFWVECETVRRLFEARHLLEEIRYNT